MVKYSSTRTVESQLFPGVTFTLRKMSEKRRAELLRALAPFKEPVRDYQRKFERINERRVLVFNEDGSAKMSVETAKQETKWATIEDEQEAVFMSIDFDEYSKVEINPAYLRWGLASIDGLEIEGHEREPITADLLLDEGPPELVAEIVKEIKDRSELTAEQEKKSESDTTPTAPAPQPATNPSSATNAKSAAPSSEETARGSSPNS